MRMTPLIIFFPPRKTIRALEEENRKIEAEIEAQKIKRNETIEGDNLTKILTLVDQYLTLDKEVRTGTKTVHEVDKQLSFASARLAKLHSKVEAANLAAGKSMEFSNKEVETKEFNAKKKLETVNRNPKKLRLT